MNQKTARDVLLQKKMIPSRQLVHKGKTISNSRRAAGSCINLFEMLVWQCISQGRQDQTSTVELNYVNICA